MTKVFDHFGNTPLARIGLAEVEQGARKAYPTASAATRNRQFIAAVAALRYAARRGLCPMPIVVRPKQDETAHRWLRFDEAQKLIACSSEHLRPLVVFLLYTGARAGEALWLDWSNVDLFRGHVSFPRSKNGEPRGVPLRPRVIDADQPAALRGRGLSQGRWQALWPPEALG